MNNSKPEERLKDLELEINVLELIENEASLKKEMAFRKAIESAIPSGIAVVDDTGKQVYVNKSFCNLVGWDEDELIGKHPPYEYWAKNDIENINNALNETLNNNISKEGFDLVFKHKTGKLIPVHVIISPFVQEDSKTFFLANVLDITERKKAEEKLKESETKFKEIINQINDVIIVFDQQGKIIIWNKGAEQICGLKAEEILNKSIVDIQYQFTPPPFNDKELIESKINGIITLETPEIFNKLIDSEIITADSGNLRNIQSMVFPIELSGSHLFCTVIRDTTEIKRYEKELLRISSDKDKFYSVIAQYLYTPSNVFKNASKLMTEELDNLPLKEIQKMAVMMGKSATNLYNLLDNLLQWTKMNQGKINFEPQKLKLDKICQDAVSILKPTADEKNIRIDHYVADGITVFADSFMLKTVLINLISNAINFTNKDGIITISAEKTPSNLTISVLDSRTGKIHDYLTKLFNISEVHTALDLAEEKGTTLGLLLCKEFVEKHGGKIWIDRKNGKGTEFKFTLPVG
jgi:PAS domain S-box-containing protein